MQVRDGRKYPSSPFAKNSRMMSPPWLFNNPIPDHTESYIDETWIIHCLVARLMEMSEVGSIPAAGKAMGVEWKKLTYMKCWEIAASQAYDD